MTPPLLHLPGEPEYRARFVADYVNGAHFTADHIRVNFYSDHFDHAFFESSNRRVPQKDVFAVARAERMPWIAATLQDPSAQVLAGWLADKKAYTYDRRAAILLNQYVVIIRLAKAKNVATFVTAFPLSPGTTAKITQAPIWDRSKCPWGP